MRIWATGTSTSNASTMTPAAGGEQAGYSTAGGNTAARGFTLLELLVVVLIIGITLALVVPVLDPGGDRVLEEEGRRLAALLRLATEEAVLEGREFAVELSPDGYRFLRLESQGWQALSDSLLRPRQLPTGLQLEVFFEGQRFDFLRNEEQEIPPRLYILSSGELTPAEILLSDERSERNVSIRVAINGLIRIEDQDGEG